MYGYRARIGYCSPPFVTETFAYEFYQMVPQGVTLLITTLEVRTRAPDEIKASHARSLEAAKYMASAGADVVVLGILALLWRPLLAATIHEELARAEGVPVAAVRVVFVLLVAIVIATAMKVVGILLITALLIIPAAAARQFARSPEQMALLAVLAGALSVVFGLGGSLQWDTPAGPSVVVAAAALFAG